MTSYSDQLRAAMERTAQRKRQRGRPRADEIAVGDVDTPRGTVALVLEVHALAHAIIAQSDITRGAQAQAIREIARKRRIPEAVVAQAIKRHRSLRDAAAVIRRIDEVNADMLDLRRRMHGFPANVRRALAPLPAHRVLEILREARIKNGYCPRWLASWATEKVAGEPISRTESR